MRMVNKRMVQGAAALMASTGLAQGGLLLHYAFNDANTATTGVTDSSGNGLSGWFQQQGIGGAALQTAPGVSGRAGDYAYNGTAAAGMGSLSTGANAGRIKYAGAGFNSGYQSITVCGWFKTESAPISNAARLLAAVGTEGLSFFAVAEGELRFQIGQGSYVDSGANTYGHAGVWMFIAVTYDSTVPAGRDNLTFWIGDANGLSLVKSAELAGAGAWDGLGETADVSIGNRHGTTAGHNLDRPFDGYIDDFRIYGKETGSGGALAEPELEAIRAGAFGAVAATPRIVLQGADPAVVYCGGEYVDAGAVLPDGGTLTVSTHVNTSRIGVGAVVYRASRADGTVSAAVRDVHVLPAADGGSALTGAISVPDLFPEHPRLVLNSGDLAVIRGRIDAGQRPHRSVWDHLSLQCASTYTANPYVGTDRGTFTNRAQTEGGRALGYALVYRLGGQSVHADRAVAILAAWAQTDPLPGTALVDEVGSGSGMFVSRGVFPMIYAADLLWDYHGFDGGPKAAFTAWMQALVPLIEESIAAWEANDYFNKQYYQNHLSAHALGLASIGNLLGDPDMMQRALDSVENPRDYRELIEGTILMPGDAVCIRETSPHSSKIPPGGWPAPEAGEIYDRYRHHTAPLRGLQYSYLSLSLLSTLAETGRNLGLDLWRTTSPGGENLRLPHEYYCDFYRLKDAGIKSGFYAMGGPYTLGDYTGSDETYRLGLAGDSGAIFELGYSRFPASRPLRRFLQGSGRSAWEDDPLLGPVALTHGVADESLKDSGFIFILMGKPQ